MELEFTGAVIEWRGPPPYYFVAIPDPQSGAIGSVAGAFTYGWGVIPVRAMIGGNSFTTSLFPRGGGYLLPLKDAVRRPAGIGVGDVVKVTMSLVPA